MTYNEIIQQVGKKLAVDVYYNNGTTTHVNEDNIQKTKIFFKSDLLGTAINGCELTLQEEIEGAIYIDVEASYGEYTQTKTYGPYYIKEVKYNADELTYEYILYDNLISSMVDYEALEVVYPITNYNFFKTLTTKLGYTNNIALLPNGTIQMTTDIYNNIGYTYRDVLDDIAIANGVCFYLDGNEIKIVQKATNTIEINDDILKNQNIDFGEHFGPINSIVLSRGGEGDNVYIKDDASISQYGLCEFKIVDNQLMNENNRDEYLNALATQLFGIEYDIYDTELVGYGDIKIQDEVEFETGETTYTSYVFNNEIVITGGYKQTIYNEIPSETETDYKSASKTDRTINKAYIIARKAEAEVEILASKVVDLSNIIEGHNSITLEDAYEGALHNLSIWGDMSLLFPQDNQYPSGTKYPLSSILKVDSDEYLLDLDYLRYLSASVYDEFVYTDGKCKIIRRVGIDQNNQMYALDDPVEEEREDIVIYVKGNSTIQMKSFGSLYYKSEYLLENKYTSTFANQVEVKSEINLLGDTIEQKVSQVADDNGNITSASIILAVNNDSSSAEINAKKINLNGIVTANGNFKILEDGSMETTNGTFSGQIKGGKIELLGFYSENDPYIKIDTPLDDPTGYKTVLLHNSGLRVIDYLGTEETRNVEATIRTETLDGYAELDGTQVNAFGFNNVSLLEKKDNIVKYQENALELIKDIDIYNYTYKGQIGEKRHIGVVIGDGYKYRKEITNDENNSIDLYSFVSLCCKAIQEQQEQIDELRKEIEKCKK